MPRGPNRQYPSAASIRASIESYRLVATDADHETGRAWYRYARLVCHHLADAYSIPLPTAAGVLAALSPNNTWNTNLRDADNLIRHHQTGRDLSELSPLPRTYALQTRKAWSILTDNIDDPNDVCVVLGPQAYKTIAFYRNILDPNCRDVTIDRWVLRALDVPIGTISEGFYRQCEQAFRDVADEIGCPVSELQAIVWVASRADRMPF